MGEKKILLVEDEEDLRELIEERLTAEGYEVHTAENGNQGLARAKELKPDLIISDVIMPEKDGNQFFKDLRATEEGKNIPFIVLTARAKMRDYFEVVDVDAFFDKPFDFDELLETIKDLVEHGAGQGGSRSKKESSDKMDPQDGGGISVQDEVMLNDAIMESPEPEQQKIDAEKIPEKKKDERPRISSSTDQKRIIVLEDDLVTFHELQKYLHKRNYAVELVIGAKECQQEVSRLEPDVILLKNVIGELNAEKLAAQLKKNPLVARTPIIVYQVFGEKVRQVLPNGEKVTEFVLTAEGKELVRRVYDLLG